VSDNHVFIAAAIEQVGESPSTSVRSIFFTVVLALDSLDLSEYNKRLPHFFRCTFILSILLLISELQYLHFTLLVPSTFRTSVHSFPNFLPDPRVFGIFVIFIMVIINKILTKSIELIAVKLHLLLKKKGKMKKSPKIPEKTRVFSGFR